MVLGTLVTAAYWKKQVEDHFKRDCNIYTISVDMPDPDPDSDNFKLVLDDKGYAKDTSDGKITTNGPMMNPSVCFNEDWLAQYFVGGNLDGNKTIYPENTIGSQRVLGILDAINAAKTGDLDSTFGEYRAIYAGAKPDEVKAAEAEIDKKYKDTLTSVQQINDEKEAKKEKIIKYYNPLISHGNFWKVVDAHVFPGYRRSG